MNEKQTLLIHIAFFILGMKGMLKFFSLHTNFLHKLYSGDELNIHYMIEKK